MSQNLSAQIVCPSPKVWNFGEKRLHWPSVVRVHRQLISRLQRLLFAHKKLQAFFDRACRKVFFFVDLKLKLIKIDFASSLNIKSCIERPFCSALRFENRIFSLFEPKSVVKSQN